MQHDCMESLNRKRGPEVWQFRWSVTGPDFAQQEIFAPLGLRRGAYICREKRFLAVWYTKCPQI